MYNEFFGFSESPFNITPNSRFYYRTLCCEEALGIVRHGIETRKGVIVVTGEAGTGKTLFLKSLASDMGSKVRTVIAYNPHTDLNGFLRLLLHQFDLEDGDQDSTAMFDRLNGCLIQQRRKNCTVCLLIDEAQDLDEKTLDELRLLSNMEFEDEALLPIVLLGQPELHSKLDRPSARRIKQRIALVRHTYPLIRREVGPYLGFRLQVADYKGPDLFGREALDKIAAYSGGIPRMVNSICDNSLMRAFTANQRVIAPEIIDQVAHEMRIETRRPLQKRSRSGGSHELRGEVASVANADKPVSQDPSRSQPKAPAEETGEQEEKSEATAVHPQTADFLPADQARAAESCHGAPEKQESPDSDSKEPPGRDSDSRANASELSALYAEPPKDHRPMSLHSLWGAWSGIPYVSADFRLYWYAGAAALGLLMLSFGTIVSFSQLGGVYSPASATGRAPSQQLDVSEAAQTLGGNGALKAPLPPSSAISRQAQTEMAALSAAQGEETYSNEEPREVNGKSDALSGAPPLLLQNDKPPRAQAADSPREINGKKGHDPVTTVKVVSASLVRNKPTDSAEIISTLEPGSRVTVLARSRDYYHVRSMDKKPIRGYVHREDAFFDRWK